MSKHETGDICPSCEEKLLWTHSKLADWYRALKKLEPSCHISWSFRNAKDQAAAYAKGTTKLHWPNSKHNRLVDKKPESVALDLFLLDADGIAKWPPAWFVKINDRNIASHEPIIWGGVWTQLGDGDHFQLKDGEYS